MRRKKLLSVLLAASMCLSNTIVPISADVSELQTENAQQAYVEEKEPIVPQMNVIKVYMGNNGKVNNDSTIVLSENEESADVYLGDDDEITVRVLASDGNAMNAGTDYVLKSENGQEFEFVQDLDSVYYQAKGVSEDTLTLYNTDNEEVAIIRLHNGENISVQSDEYDGPMAAPATITPTATSLPSATATPEQSNTSIDKAVDLPLDTTITVNYTGSELYYKFVPSEKASYWLYSEGNYDTYAILLDEDGNPIYSDDDGGTGNNFLITYELEAGKVYYLKVRQYSYWGDAVAFSITASKAITAEEFAQEAESLELTTEKAVSVENLNSMYYDKAYALNVSKTGFYNISVVSTDSAVSAEFYDDKYKSVDTVDYYNKSEYVSDENCYKYTNSYTVFLKADKTEYLFVEMGSGQSEVTLSFSNEDVKELKYDEAEDVKFSDNKNHEIYKFVPEETTEYWFYSEGNYNTYGILLDEDGNQITYDNNGGIDSNFLIKQELEAGKAYYLKVSLQYYYTDEEAEFQIVAKKAITPEEFAQKAESLEPTTEKAVSAETLNPAYYDKAYKLNVSETGFYNISLVSTDSAVSAAFYDDKYEFVDVIDYDNKSEYLENENCYKYTKTYKAFLQADKTEYLFVEMGNIQSEVTLSFSNTDVKELKYNEAEDVKLSSDKTYEIYKFVPGDTANYWLYSQGNYNTYAELYDENGEVVIRDNNSGDNWNFKINRELEAGKVYYLKVSLQSYYTDEEAEFKIAAKKAVTNAELVKNAEKLELGTVTPVAIEMTNPGFADKAYSFEVSESGIYTVSLVTTGNAVSADFRCFLDEEYSEYSSVTKIYTDRSLDSVTYNIGLQAGKKYYMFLEMGTEIVPVTLAFNEADFEEIKAGESKKVSVSYDASSVIYKFVADNTAKYDIYSADIVTGAYVYVYNENFGYNYKRFSDTNNHFTYSFEKGKTYYIKVERRYDDSAFTLNIDKAVVFKDLLQKCEDTINIANNATEASIDVKADSLNDFYYEKLVKFDNKKAGYYQIKIEGIDNTYVNDENGFQKAGADICNIYYGENGNSSDYNCLSEYKDGKYTVTYTDYFSAQEYYIALEYENDKDRSYKVTVSEYVPQEIKAGNSETITVEKYGAKKIYSFTPEKDGEYLFATSGSNGGEICLYSPKHKTLDSSSKYSSYVYFTHKLYAGKTYTVEVVSYQDSGEYSFAVDYAKSFEELTANAKELKLANGATESAVMPVTAESVNVADYDGFVKLVVSNGGFYNVRIARDLEDEWSSTLNSNSFKIVKEDNKSFSYDTASLNTENGKEYYDINSWFSAGVYYIKLEYGNDTNKPFYVSFSEAATEISTGELYNIKSSEIYNYEYTYLKFVPQETGRYVFATSDSKYIESSVYIYDENHNDIQNGNYYKDEDSEWSYSLTLKAGKTYYVRLENYAYSSDNVMNFSVNKKTASTEDVFDAKDELVLTEVTDAAVQLAVSKPETLNDNGYDAYVKLVTNVDASYRIRIECVAQDEKYRSIPLYDEYGVRMDSLYNYNSYSEYYYDYHLEKGTYYLAFEYGNDSSIQYSIYLEQFADREIEEDTRIKETVYSGLQLYYKFVPSEDGEYSFYTEGSDYAKGYLYDESFTLITSDTKNTPLLITEKLTAGKTYYIAARDYYWSTYKDSFTIGVSKKKGFEDLVKSAVPITLAENATNAAVNFTVEQNNGDYYERFVSLNVTEPGYYTFEAIGDKNFYVNSDTGYPVILNDIGKEYEYQYRTYTSKYVYDDTSYWGYVYYYETSAYLPAGQYYFAVECGTNEEVTFDVSLTKSKYIVSAEAVPVSGQSLTYKNSADGYKRSDSIYDEVEEEYDGVSWFKFYDGDTDYSYSNRLPELYDYQVTYSDGTTELLRGSDKRIFISDNQSASNQWLPDGTNNLMTVKLDAAENVINVPVEKYPEVTDIEIKKYNDTPLTIGRTSYWASENYYDRDGYWTESYDYETESYQKYFHFDDIDDDFSATLTFSDGTTKTGSIWNLYKYGLITYSTNQSAENPWLPDGENNTLTITSTDDSGFSKDFNIEVQNFIEMFVDSAETVSETSPVALSFGKHEEEDNYYYYTNQFGFSDYVYYRNIVYKTAALFTPDEDGVYNFYTTGSDDPYMKLFDSVGNVVAEDDDSYGGLNAKLSAELKAGETYIVYTPAYNFCKNNDYETYYGYNLGINVSKEDVVEDEISFENMDLSGKYINLSFVVDSTNSMADEIAAVRDSLTEFVDSIGKTGATLRISFIDYKDLEFGGETYNKEDTTVLHYAPSYSLWFENSDLEALKTEINNLTVDGGGDEPECVVDALANVADPEIMNFNAAAAKFAFLLTDASYKENNTHDLSGMTELIKLLQAEDIAVSVVTSKDLYVTYEDLVKATGGTFIDITKDISKGMTRFAAKIVEETDDFEPDKDIIQVTEISLGEDLTVPEGKIKNFVPVIKPENATNKKVDWEIEDESIAVIDTELTNDEQLVIQGVKTGKTRILARSKDGGYTAYFDLSVTKEVIDGDSMESCDIGSIIDKIKDIIGNVIEDIIKDFVYLDDLSDSDKLEVDAESQKTIYDSIKDSDKSISFIKNDSYGDINYGWTFNGKTVSDTSIEVKMGIDVNAASSEAATAAKEENWENFATFDFEHEGDLPGEATINAKVKDFADGIYNLFHYKNDGTFEEAGEAEVKDGIAQFSITHCSSYVMAEKPKTVPVTGITLDKTEIVLLVNDNEYNKETLTATVAPYNADTKDVTWSSSDTNVVVVENGVVKAVGLGQATITASCAGFTATCVVTVKEKEIPPTPTPTVEPTETPTVEPTETPTVEPTETPTVEPTETPTVEPTETPSVEYTLGDVDNDNEVTLADVLLVLKNSLGIVDFDDTQKLAGDVDGDGVVTLTDTLKILKVALGIEVFDK